MATLATKLAKHTFHQDVGDFFDARLRPFAALGHSRSKPETRVRIDMVFSGDLNSVEFAFRNSIDASRLDPDDKREVYLRTESCERGSRFEIRMDKYVADQSTKKELRSIAGQVLRFMDSRNKALAKEIETLRRDPPKEI